jgi:hypothetical protein
MSIFQGVDLNFVTPALPGLDRLAGDPPTVILPVG